MTLSSFFSETFNMESIYRTIGGLLFVYALLILADSRNRSSKTWGAILFLVVYGVTFAFGSRMPPAVTGACVVMMPVLAILGGPTFNGRNAPPNEQRKSDANPSSRRFLLPFLLPLASTLLLYWGWDVNPLVAFGASHIVLLVFLMPLMRESPVALARDGQRMFESLGWYIALPQFLAALGAVFAEAGMGDVVLEMIDAFVTIDGKLAAAAVYCIATAFFSMVMGNAFPAFLVVTSGVGIPLVVRGFGADPAIAGVFAMTSGYCGTLMTPMAVNFNALPAERLGIRNMNEVIAAQVGTALPLLLVNIGLMYFLAF
ncbi:DUF979 family protein [Fretibacterium sp. OH1220_COT-178]|nr:DUF979 family protein [Fretibacterium sp. OH1220_COT-178]